MHERQHLTCKRGDRWIPKEGPHKRGVNSPKSKTTKGTSEVKVGFIDELQRGRLHALSCDV